MEIYNFSLLYAVSIWGVLFYWLPLLLCAVGYTIRTAQDVQADYAARAEAEKTNAFYNPTVRIGTLIGRAIITLIPVGNLMAAAFDVGPKLFGNFFRMLGDIFNQPLVPKRK